MPTNTADQQLTMPILADAANNQTAFSSFAAGVESRLVKRYVDLADRTARNAAPTAGEISYLTSTGMHYQYTGAAWWELYPIVRRKPANQTVTNSTVLVNDVSLVIPVQANATYVLDGVIVVDGPAAGDIKFTFAVPVGAGSGIFSLLGGGTGIVSTNTSVDIGVPAGIGSTHLRGTLGAGVLITNIFQADVFTVANAGNVQLQWAQNTADPGNTRVMGGSWIRANRVA